ncbi:hypothetical protein B0H67DRAFT_573009 [Lasiosphaeris hirsuta]|uniref:Uncharacterized protein n=1 Tax=Lasiosphaeris hirsuta TaxID=260670 RepID=A0AA40E1N6_9PEZI|nr:hypothetical protein B0H67DRAFT_573009 [Lasiosphaeris hirsuta]
MSGGPFSGGFSHADISDHATSHHHGGEQYVGEGDRDGNSDHWGPVPPSPDPGDIYTPGNGTPGAGFPADGEATWAPPPSPLGGSDSSSSPPRSPMTTGSPEHVPAPHNGGYRPGTNVASYDRVSYSKLQRSTLRTNAACGPHPASPSAGMAPPPMPPIDFGFPPPMPPIGLPPPTPVPGPLPPMPFGPGCPFHAPAPPTPGANGGGASYPAGTIVSTWGVNMVLYAPSMPFGYRFQTPPSPVLPDDHGSYPEPERDWRHIDSEDMREQGPDWQDGHVPASPSAYGSVETDEASSVDAQSVAGDRDAGGCEYRRDGESSRRAHGASGKKQKSSHKRNRSRR